MQIRAVLLDFGDTLVHTSSGFDHETCLLSLHQSLTKNGIYVSYEDYKRVHTQIREELFSENSLREVTFSFLGAKALRHFGYSLKPTDKIVTEATEAFIEPWIQARTIEECIPSVLRRLKKNYELGVVSNFGHSPAVTKTLERFDLAKFFDTIIVSADVGWRKPSPKIFKTALQTLKVLASESVFVGDELDHDVEGAKNVGMRTILLKLPSMKETRHRVKPDETIHELKELPDALNSLEAAYSSN